MIVLHVVGKDILHSTDGRKCLKYMEYEEYDEYEFRLNIFFSNLASISANSHLWFFSKSSLFV